MRKIIADKGEAGSADFKRRIQERVPEKGAGGRRKCLPPAFWMSD